MRINTLQFLIALAAAGLAAGAAALAFGSADLSLREIAVALFDQDAAPGHKLIAQLRLQRAASAFAVGGLLALAGVFMQVLLRNPLADPYVLGTSGGAAVAALLATLAGFTTLAIDFSAFIGAAAATAFVYLVARSGMAVSPARLLLTGIVLASGFAAMISVLLALAPEQGVKGMLFWLMGDFSFSRNAGPVWLLLIVSGTAAMFIARELNVLARGEIQAKILGQNVNRLQAVLFLASALLTAVAVSTAGPIGFIGLVVPHLIRLVVGSDHRRVVPGAILAGGTLMVVADTSARTIVAPLQLPVGALTAFIGVPTFLILMSRTGASGLHQIR